ncbi:hypothetical protein SAMN04487914_13925 [Arthrobacter sp. ok909]|nr:hypothetical protein SAMN04487914_13925 [Arthrobacter sp. ok909]
MIPRVARRLRQRCQAKYCELGTLTARAKTVVAIRLSPETRPKVPSDEVDGRSERIESIER